MSAIKSELVRERNDRVFPPSIVRVSPPGVTGLVIAAVLPILAGSVHERGWITLCIRCACELLLLSGVLLVRREPARILVLVAAAAGIGGLHWLSSAPIGVTPRLVMAYAWYYPLGTLMTFVLGCALGRRKGDAKRGGSEFGVDAKRRVAQHAGR